MHQGGSGSDSDSAANHTRILLKLLSDKQANGGDKSESETERGEEVEGEEEGGRDLQRLPRIGYRFDQDDTVFDHLLELVWTVVERLKLKQEENPLEEMLLTWRTWDLNEWDRQSKANLPCAFK